VSDVRTPNRALTGTGFPFKNLEFLDDYLQQFERITRAGSGIRRAGSAVIVREAGGRITDLVGRDIVPTHTPVVASNGHLHDWLLGCLRDDV
jgi:myo-inositol-1(or 4)-monophosphatase